MNTNKFIAELFTGSEGSVAMNDENTIIVVKIPTSKLRDNIELLSRQMHMDVDMKAKTSLRKLRHNKIILDSQELMKEMEAENGRHNREV